MTSCDMRRVGAVCGAVAMLLLACLSAGCYERVVRARGPGASRVDVYEPNLEDKRIPIVDDAEDAIFGPRSESQPR